MGVSKNNGTRKWMVYNGKPIENPIKMDDLGVPLFLETPMEKDMKMYAPPRGVDLL